MDCQTASPENDSGEGILEVVGGSVNFDSNSSEYKLSVSAEFTEDVTETEAREMLHELIGSEIVVNGDDNE